MPTVVTFDYNNHRGEFTPNRRVLPTGFYHGEMHWFPGIVGTYLTGHCLDRKAERSFLITRMLLVRFVEDPAVPPPPSLSEVVVADLREMEKAGPDVVTVGRGAGLAEAYHAAILLAVALRRKIVEAGMPAEALKAAAQLDRPWQKVIDARKIGPRGVRAMGEMGVGTMRELLALTDEELAAAQGLGAATIGKMHQAAKAAGFVPGFGDPRERPAAEQFPPLSPEQAAANVTGRPARSQP